MRRFARLALVWVFFFVAGVSRARTAGETDSPTSLALLVGSGAYHGREDLMPLQFTDEDVVRFAGALRGLVDPKDMQVLMVPDDLSEAQARALGLNTWANPTRENFRRAVTRLGTKIDRAHDRNQHVRLFVFISAHGDRQGVHLDDGLLKAEVLRAELAAMGADELLVVADSCFSTAWFGFKGDPADKSPAVLPLDALADALRGLDQAGSVTAQSYTREDRGLIRGGILTHVVSTALAGPADLDMDGMIRYDELSGYLSRVSLHIPSLGHIDVHPPRRTKDYPPVLIDLADLPSRGILFESTPRSGNECFWITSDRGIVVGEFCKRGRDARRLYLPPGRYTIRMWTPPERRWGYQTTRRVDDGFVALRPSDIDHMWTIRGAKGLPSMPGNSAATPLAPKEADFILSTQIVEVPTWRDLPNRVQARFQVVTGFPVPPPKARENEADLRAVSLTQEKPSAAIEALVDWRVIRLKTTPGFWTLGFGASALTSLHNQVGWADDVTVFGLQGLIRIGLELPRGRQTFRLTTRSGLLSATPYFDHRLALFDGEAPGTGHPLSYSLPLGINLGVSVGIEREMEAGPRLSLGFGPQAIFEPHIHGESLDWVFYPGLIFSTGIGF